MVEALSNPNHLLSFPTSPHPPEKMKTQLPIFLLFLTCLSLLHLLQSSLAASTNKEAQSLISFKSTLGDSSVLHDWLPTSHPCSFHGVKCQESTSSVSSIDLSSIKLSTDFHHVGTFLLTLESLESLNLRSTNLSGSISIPSGSKCSSLLSYLDLSQNGISGPVSDIANLGNCPALATLNLSSNSLGYFSVKERALPSTKLTLVSLDLSFNLINGVNVVPFILSGGCSRLKFMSLKGNRVNGDLVFSKCKSLVHLDVSSNNFSSGVPSFGDCLALTHLDISSNKFYGDLGSSIGSCERLSYLNVSTNLLFGPVPTFPVESLQVLSLGGNHFQGGIPLYLVDACPGFTLLDLSSNNLSGPVPAGFASCTLLQSFDISSNNFSGALPVDTLLKMSSLRELDLSFNGYHGAFPDSLSQQTGLETLDLSANYLSGPLPAGLCEDPRFNLKELYLQDNLFSGSIPAALANCSQLTALHLSFNYLNGTIPSSLGSLPELRDLKLLFNQLEGGIPPELANIRTLETLILDFNYLTGPIPSSISNLTNLNWVSLSNNQLSGDIPALIGRLPSLAILKLSNNSLSGRIPRELGDARSLVWLDLNSNLLNGTIPPELFKQSGTIDVNFISGKRYVLLENWF